MRKLLIFALMCLLFLPVVATADTILVDSRAGLSYICTTTPNCTTGITMVITPNPAWASPIGTSQWISYAQTGTPDVGTANGTQMSVMDTFTAISNGIIIHAMADDTTSVVAFFPAIFNYPAALPDGINTYATCSDITIGCLNSTAGNFFVPVVPGQTYGVYFDVHQINGSSFGLDYEITSTPEPSTLGMLGSGLLSGPAFCLRRRFRK